MIIDKKIAIIGMPRVGKTTVGALVAKEFGVAFYDTDGLLLQQSTEADSIAELYAVLGAAGFHAREYKLLQQLTAYEEAFVLSTGGGIVTEPDSRKLLAEYTVVLLTAPAETIVRRILDKAAVLHAMPGFFPCAGCEHRFPHDLEYCKTCAENTVNRLLDSRDELYESLAAITVPNEESAEKTAAAICLQLVNFR